MEIRDYEIRNHYVNKSASVEEQCYVALYSKITGKRISPYVREITFEEETGLFLVKDIIPVNCDLNCDIYFYMDEWGCPKGFAWSNLVDYFVDIEEYFRDFDFVNQEAYRDFLLSFASQVREELKKREEAKKKNARTMVKRFGKKL